MTELSGDRAIRYDADLDALLRDLGVSESQIRIVDDYLCDTRSESYDDGYDD